LAQVRFFYVSNIKKELAFYGKTLLLNKVQVQVILATFLIEDNERIIEDFEVEELELNNLEIIEQFDIKNIVCLNNEIFQDNESDVD
ncbi:16962_t:CDS:1, partial [Cetraspora pellucida]